MDDKPVTPLGYLLRALWDALILNLLCILTSLPIITIGAAGSAVYSVLLRRDRDGELPVVKSYFKSFVTGFLPATGLFLIIALLGVIAWADIRFALTFEGTLKIVYLVVGCLIALGCVVVAFIAIPMQSAYKNTFKNYLKNAFALAFVSPGRLVLIMLVWAIPVTLALLLPYKTVLRLAVAYFLWGFSGPAFISSIILNRLFEKIQADRENQDDKI